jgi:hypothetical protein
VGPAENETLKRRWVVYQVPDRPKHDTSAGGAKKKKKKLNPDSM